MTTHKDLCKKAIDILTEYLSSHDEKRAGRRAEGIHEGVALRKLVELFDGPLQREADTNPEWTLNQLQDLASRTLPELNKNYWFRPNFTEPMGPEVTVHMSHAQRIDFVHAIFGAIGELGEAVDPLKKNMFYGKPMTVEMWANVREEIGDKVWYLVATFCRALRCSFQELAEENIKKLRIRYPDKYTDEAAWDRADKKETPTAPVLSESGKTIVPGYYSSTASVTTQNAVAAIEDNANENNGDFDRDAVAKIIQDALDYAYKQGAESRPA